MAQKVHFTDGTEVRAGDRVRYKQAPGGMLPPSQDWKYGVAEPFVPHAGYDWADELSLHAEDGRWYNLGGHIIERAEATV